MFLAVLMNRQTRGNTPRPSRLSNNTQPRYKYPTDFASLFFRDPRTPRVERPTAPPDPWDKTNEFIFKEQIKQFVSRSLTLEQNLAAIWAVAFGQCTDAMKVKLESIPEFKHQETTTDCEWLLKTILSVTVPFDQCQYGYLAIMEAHQKFLSCIQSPLQTLNNYRQQLSLWSERSLIMAGQLSPTRPLPPLSTRKDNHAPTEQ